VRRPASMKIQRHDKLTVLAVTCHAGEPHLACACQSVSSRMNRLTGGNSSIKGAVRVQTTSFVRKQRIQLQGADQYVFQGSGSGSGSSCRPSGCCWRCSLGHNGRRLVREDHCGKWSWSRIRHCLFRTDSAAHDSCGHQRAPNATFGIKDE
jgi:hypothetical protein